MTASTRPPLVTIVGPTASGKSALAVRLAKKFGGEIVSADSRQVYRGLDIGTGKISRREMRGVPHHLLDVADPRRQFSVAEFQDRARKAITGIHRLGRMPFLVGGTMFWADAVAYGILLPRVTPDAKLRKRLGKKTPAALFSMLKRIDPARARTVEQKNPRRLIRAIEIAKAIGQTPKAERRMPYRLLSLGLRPAPGVLRNRIVRRADQMISLGIAAETRALIRRGVPRTRIREFGFEYHAVLDFVDKRISRIALRDEIIRGSLAYARRQMTWWWKNKAIRWLKRPTDAERLVRTFIPLETGRGRTGSPQKKQGHPSAKLGVAFPHRTRPRSLTGLIGTETRKVRGARTA